ncbi:MAG: sulfite exporter TauE/SafE family protein [Chloroflexota bacterium]|nr:sulfite exporter TauE/SafE family protein [Chloroflexota bacterium]
MEESTVVILLIAAVAFFMIGLAKGGLGATSATLAMPLLALVMPVSVVIGMILPVLMLADIIAVGFHWRRWSNRLLVLLIPGALSGVILGTYFITNVPPDVLRTALGIIILLFAAYKVFESRILGLFTYHPRNWHGVLAGSTSGFISTLAHTGGPPIGIYLLMQEVPPRTFVATSAMFFMILNWIKVPFYFYAGIFDLERLRQIIWILPMVPLGVWTGKQIVVKIDPKVYERIIVAILSVSALLLIFKD